MALLCTECLRWPAVDYRLQYNRPSSLKFFTGCRLAQVKYNSKFRLSVLQVLLFPLECQSRGTRRKIALMFSVIGTCALQSLLNNVKTQDDFPSTFHQGRELSAFKRLKGQSALENRLALGRSLVDMIENSSYVKFSINTYVSQENVSSF